MSKSLNKGDNVCPMAVQVGGKSSLSEIIESAHKKQKFALIPTKCCLLKMRREESLLGFNKVPSINIYVAPRISKVGDLELKKQMTMQN